MAMDTVVWEGWTVRDFIAELEPLADMVASGHGIDRPWKDKKELASWCAENQPYYKKRIPEVVEYFAARYGYRN